MTVLYPNPCYTEVCLVVRFGALHHSQQVFSCVGTISCLPGLLALVGDVYCNFVTFPRGILGQLWYLIVLYSGLCHLSYFEPVLSSR